MLIKGVKCKTFQGKWSESTLDLAVVKKRTSVNFTLNEKQGTEEGKCAVGHRRGQFQHWESAEPPNKFH